MAENGCWITNDNGLTYYNLNGGGGRAVTFLQRIKSAPGSKKGETSFSYTIANKSPNSKLFVIPITGGKVFDGGTSAVPVGIGLSGIGINGNVVTINYNDYSGFDQGSIDGDPWFYFDVYQSIDAGDNFGLYFLNDLTSFTAISDVSKSGLCVYRTTVTVSGEWAVPASVEGYGNCCVCASWDHPSAVVEFDSSRKIVTVTGGPIRLNIAVFSNGFNLRMPDYGLFIYNSAGVCTFNSLYIPFFIKNSLTLTDAYKATGVEKPMIPLCVTGVGFFKYSGNFYRIYNKGIVMSGGSIKAGQGKTLAQYNMGNYNIYAPGSNLTVNILDGSQYF
ncbi:DUF6453 family protein [Pantoea sp. FN060301]|uniref:DUF6453 family protein n=1 Tax=Pantoea sp. FN060301 TaxID=3420380 RepID=UPI003D167251